MKKEKEGWINNTPRPPFKHTTYIMRTWETSHFTTKSIDDKDATVELTINRSTKSFDIKTHSEEHVSFSRDSIEVAEARVKSIEAAIKYAKEELIKCE